MRQSFNILIAASTLGLALCGSASNSHAQSRTVPEGGALAQTPPIDQRGKQFRAQRHMYPHRHHQAR